MSALHIHRKHFQDYFANACSFAEEAESEYEKSPTGFKQQRLSQASILYSALCLEAAANCCLNHLALEKDVEDSFERLDTLAKFDLFLMMLNPDAVLNRKNVLVTPVRNICRAGMNTFIPK